MDIRVSDWRGMDNRSKSSVIWVTDFKGLSEDWMRVENMCMVTKI